MVGRRRKEPERVGKEESVERAAEEVSRPPYEESPLSRRRIRSVVCYLEMDQHKKRRRRRWALHIRRDRFLTLFGSLIVFVTFVTKEGISDSLKDLVSSVENAHNLFTIREDIAFIAHKPQAQTDSGPTSAELKDYIELWQRQSESIVSITSDLAKSLRDQKSIQEDGNKIAGNIWEIENALANAKGSTEPERFGEIKKVYDRALSNYALANQLRVRVIEEANHLKEGREKWYKIAKWSSYVLFTIGWGLTFYGQLSGRSAPSHEIA
jgi:hypothetical protein